MCLSCFALLRVLRWVGWVWRDSVCLYVCEQYIRHCLWAT